MIRYSLNHLRFLEEQLEELDRDIVAEIRQAGLEPQWKLVQSVPGVAEGSPATILAETGTDLQQLPAEGDFSSWAGVGPGNNRSADENKSSHTTGGNPWLCSIMTQCACARRRQEKLLFEGQILASHCESRRQENTRRGGGQSHALDPNLSRACERKAVPGKTRAAAERTAESPHDPAHHIGRLGKLGIAVYSSRPDPTGKRRRPRRATGKESAP
jgi:hypothetical protein